MLLKLAEFKQETAIIHHFLKAATPIIVDDLKNKLLLAAHLFLCIFALADLYTGRPSWGKPKEICAFSWDPTGELLPVKVCPHFQLLLRETIESYGRLGISNDEVKQPVYQKSKSQWECRIPLIDKW